MIGFEYEMPSLLSALATPSGKKEQKKFLKELKRAESGAEVRETFTDQSADAGYQRRDYLDSGELIDNDSGEEIGLDPDYRFHALVKKDKLLFGNGFTLEADEGNTSDIQHGAGSNTELVTDPFADGPDGREQLATAIDDFVAICGRLDELKRAGREYVHAKEVGAGGVGGKVFLTKYARFGGALQVTAAVDLRRVPELMKSMNADDAESDKCATEHAYGRSVLAPALGGSAAPAGPTGKAPVDAKTAIDLYARYNAHDLPDKFGSHRLQGLVGLMASYILSADNAHLGYAKTIAPLMARTDFAAMFALLPRDEKLHFVADANRLTTIVHHAAGGADMTQDLFPHGIYNDPRAQGGDTHCLDGLSRKRWVEGVVAGADYLTADSFNQNPDLAAPDPTAKQEHLESMGALGHKTEKISHKNRKAPIFEIRSLGQMELTTLKPRALEIFDYLCGLNDDNSHRMADY